MPEVKTLRQRHPEYDPDRLEMIGALTDGGTRWRKLISRILPQNASEPPDVYKDRQRLAGYTNHLGGILGLIAGHLFSKPAMLADGGAYWADLVADVDGRRTTWDKWWADALVDALEYRQTFAWVNTPEKAREVEPDSLLAQEKSGALDAFLVHLSGRAVIDWGEDAAGNLEWLITEAQDWKRAGPTADRTVIWRWVHYDATTVTTFEWEGTAQKPRPDGGENAREVSSVSHGAGGLPVARLRLPMMLWAGDKLHDPALRLTRKENDLDWAIHMAAHALMYLKKKWGTDAQPILGPGYYLTLEPGDEVGYVEPSGSSFTHQRDGVKDAREEMYRVVQQLAAGADTNATRQAMSAQSKGMDWKASEIMLGAYSSVVLDAMKSTAAIVERIRGSSGAAPTFSGLDGYEEEDVAAFLERAAMAIDAREMSPKFRKVVAKQEAKRILADEVEPGVLVEILDEIDAAVVEDAGIFQPTPMDGEDGGGDTIAESDVEPLNGAQMKSAKDIVLDVANGLIPREVGIQMLIEFLGIDLARAERIMGEVGLGFKTATTDQDD